MCHPCAGLIYFRAKTCFMMTPRCGERGANSVGEEEGGSPAVTVRSPAPRCLNATDGRSRSGISPLIVNVWMPYRYNVSRCMAGNKSYSFISGMLRYPVTKNYCGRQLYIVTM